MRTFFNAPDAIWSEWHDALRVAMPEIDLIRDPDPQARAILFAPGGPVADFSPFRKALIVQSLWAGVERIVGNATLTQPLCRMVDPGLAQGMVEWCCGWALRRHLQMDRYAQDGIWRNAEVPPLAASRSVTVLGMGELGRAVAQALTGLGFRVTGWSASGRPVPGIEVLAGDALPQALARAEILITLLPDTPETRDLLNAERLAMLPKGATVLNPGRGTLIDDAALIAALNAGRLGHAVLDVFRTEPLPVAHPFWAHPGVTVTPHIAAETRPESAAQLVADNLRRARDGQPLCYLVDRQRGY